MSALAKTEMDGAVNEAPPDEQIEEIRAEMIETAWNQHKFTRENRKRRAA